MSSDPAFAAHLLVLAHGVDLSDLAAATSGASDAAGVAALSTPFEPGERLLAALPADELRRHGVDLDRSSLVLRPHWRGDDHAFAWLQQRPAGLPRAAVVESRDALDAATAFGVDSPAADRARRTLAERIAVAAERLGRRHGGGPVGVWCCALGRPVPVVRTLDVHRHVRRTLGRENAAALCFAIAPHRVAVTAGHQRALASLAASLPGSLFDGCELQPAGPGAWRLVPPRGVAFGARPAAARAPLPHEADARVALPVPTSAARLDLDGVAARFGLAAAELAEREVLVDATVELRAEDAPDLLALLAGTGGARGGAGVDPDVESGAANGDGSRGQEQPAGGVDSEARAALAAAASLFAQLGRGTRAGDRDPDHGDGGGGGDRSR